MGSQARNAPLGATRTGYPLMLNAASPDPTDPKMKFESRTATTEPALGYTTVMASGPRTSGIGGSFTAFTGVPASPAAPGPARGTGVVSGAGCGAPPAQAPSSTSAPIPARRRMVVKLTEP